MKKNRKIAIAIVIVVVVILALLAIYMVNRPSTSQGTKTFTVEVVHKDESTKTFTYQPDAEYVGEVLVSEGLVQGENSEFGLYIQVVDGERASYDEDGAYWALYVNDEYAMQGADQTPVNDGDSFKLVYTIG